MKNLEEIQDLIAEKSFSEAKNELITYLETNPDDIEATKLLGLMNVNLNLFKEGAEIFEKVIKLSPDDATTIFYLGNCYDNLNLLDKAEDCYKQVIKLRKNFVEAYKNICVLYMKTGNEIKAIQRAQEAKLIEPSDYTFDYLIGTASVTLKLYNQAIEHLENALALNPEHSQIYNNLGTAYLLTGMKEKAIECYKKAIKLNPKDSVAYYNIASIYQI